MHPGKGGRDGVRRELQQQAGVVTGCWIRVVEQVKFTAWYAHWFLYDLPLAEKKMTDERIRDKKVEDVQHSLRIAKIVNVARDAAFLNSEKNLYLEINGNLSYMRRSRCSFFCFFRSNLSYMRRSYIFSWKYRPKLNCKNMKSTSF